jgi:hypothetical protein
MTPKYLVFNTYNLKFSINCILPNNGIMSLNISHDEVLRLKSVLGINIKGTMGTRPLTQAGNDPQTHEMYWHLWDYMKSPIVPPTELDEIENLVKANYGEILEENAESIPQDILNLVDKMKDLW